MTIAVTTILGSGGVSFSLSESTAIPFVASDGKLTTLVNRYNFTDDGVTVRGLSTKKVVTLLNNSGATLLSVENGGKLNLGTATIDLLQNTSVESDLLFFDTVNSRLGVGTSTPQTTFSVRSQGTSNTRGILVQHTDNTTAFSQAKIIGGRSRGTVGSPTAVQGNDSLASFNAIGYRTTAWSDTVGGMYIYAASTWNDSSTPTYITFRGVNTGTTVAEWARLNGSGLSVNTTTQSAMTHVRGNSDTVGNIVKFQNLSDTSSILFTNTGVMTVLQPSGGSNFTSLSLQRGGLEWLAVKAVGGEYGVHFGSGVTGSGLAKLTCTQSTVTLYGWATAGKQAIIFANGNTTAHNNTSQFQFGANTSVTYSFGGSASNNIILNINQGVAINAGSANSEVKLLSIDSTINQTGGTASIMGFVFEPTITAVTQNMYGIIIRPNTYNGIGLGTTLPSSNLDISGTNGHNQFRLRTQYTPTGSADLNGSTGQVCFDANYIYYKTAAGWKRSALSTF